MEINNGYGEREDIGADDYLTTSPSLALPKVSLSHRPLPSEELRPKLPLWLLGDRARELPASEEDEPRVHSSESGEWMRSEKSAK